MADGPIETAYQALAALLRTTLVDAGFLPAPELLEIDPESPFEPAGDETTLVTAAALVNVRTGPVRTLLGGGGARYVVERRALLDLAGVGPARAERLALAAATLNALAALAESDPRLGGACERFYLVEQTDDELPPNGVTMSVTWALRVRSSDPLGRSA